MDLKDLHPGDLLAYPETGVQELMRIFLMRTNFVPGIRHVMGWRGIKDSSVDVLGWTARIKDFSGIFGISFAVCHSFGNWVQGKFPLRYFPDPNEDLVEVCSVQAIAVTQQDDYYTRVREFLKYWDLCELFTIASIDLCFSRSGDALLLGLESASQQRTVARDGISVMYNGRPVEIVAPGGYDRNFPSYNTSLAFFRVYAASITFNLNEPPAHLLQAHCKGEEIVYTSGGEVRKRPSDGIQNRWLYLGYGMAADTTALELIASSNVPCSIDFSWNKDDDDPVTEYDDELWWCAHTVNDYKTLDKRVLGIDERPQLIVVTGFLGSGKTTFIRNFIEYHVQHNRFVAVIQNEIGEAGLDGKLLDHDYSVIEIDEGCVCCTLVGSLKRGIHQILSQFQPDYIIVETTGLANPFNLLEELSEVEDIVKFDSVTTIVDGVNADSLENFDVACRQIEAADVLLLNKNDLLTGERNDAIIRKLRDINKKAPILSVVHGHINPALLYGINPQEFQERLLSDRWESSHDTYSSHEHDGLQSITIYFPIPVKKDLFIKKIASLSPALFRVKGIIDFCDSDTPYLFQYVNGRSEISEFKNLGMRERFLTLIGQDITPKKIQDTFKTLGSHT